MSALSGLRCFNHGEREAAAQCLSCGRYYCRECVTEHGGRITCAGCLKAITNGHTPTRSFRLRVMRPLLALGSFLLLWGLFVLAGRLLLSLPDTFHDAFEAEVIHESTYPEDS